MAFSTAMYNAPVLKRAAFEGRYLPEKQSQFGTSISLRVSQSRNWIGFDADNHQGVATAQVFRLGM
jgi:hypothetical protein